MCETFLHSRTKGGAWLWLQIRAWSFASSSWALWEGRSGSPCPRSVRLSVHPCPGPRGAGPRGRRPCRCRSVHLCLQINVHFQRDLNRRFLAAGWEGAARGWAWLCPQPPPPPVFYLYTEINNLYKTILMSTCVLSFFITTGRGWLGARDGDRDQGWGLGLEEWDEDEEEKGRGWRSGMGIGAIGGALGWGSGSGLEERAGDRGRVWRSGMGSGARGAGFGRAAGSGLGDRGWRIGTRTEPRSPASPPGRWGRCRGRPARPGLPRSPRPLCPARPALTLDNKDGGGEQQLLGRRVGRGAAGTGRLRGPLGARPGHGTAGSPPGPLCSLPGAGGRGGCQPVSHEAPVPAE